MINEEFLAEEYADSLGRLWRSEERAILNPPITPLVGLRYEELRLLNLIIEARDSPLAGAIAADLESCALDTPCAQGCPYDLDAHYEDCPQETTVGLLIALARAVRGGRT